MQQININHTNLQKYAIRVELVDVFEYSYACAWWPWKFVSACWSCFWGVWLSIKGRLLWTDWGEETRFWFYIKRIWRLRSYKRFQRLFKHTFRQRRIRSMASRLRKLSNQSRLTCTYYRSRCPPWRFLYSSTIRQILLETSPFTNFKLYQALDRLINNTNKLSQDSKVSI